MDFYFPTHVLKKSFLWNGDRFPIGTLVCYGKRIAFVDAEGHLLKHDGTILDYGTPAVYDFSSRMVFQYLCPIRGVKTLFKELAKKEREIQEIHEHLKLLALKARQKIV